MKNHSVARGLRSFKSEYPATTCTFIAFLLAAHAQAQDLPSSQTLPEVVVSVSRSEQNRFDAPAAIDVVQINSFSAQSPLVNMSELLAAVPGVQVRERQNYAQDLQISV